MFYFLGEQVQLLTIVLQKMGADAVAYTGTTSRDNVDLACVRSISALCCCITEDAKDVPVKSGTSELGSN